MANVFRELFTSIVVLPITAGNYRSRQNGAGYYDGTISSMVFFLIFLAIVIILTFSKDIDTGEDMRLAIVFILLTVIMIIGMISCAILGFLIKFYGLDRVVLRRRERNAVNLQLIFLWIFGLSSGLLSAFLAGQQFQCEVSSQTIDAWGDVFWYSRGIFNVSMVIFLSTEMIFISYFDQFQVKCSTPVRYSLFILVVVNVSVWLHSIITDNESFPENILDKHFNNKSKILDCLQNETVGNLLDISKPILDPCLLEFCLLSTTMLFEMWSQNIPQTSSGETFSEVVSQTFQNTVEWNHTSNETERYPLLGNATQNHENNVPRCGFTKTAYHLVILILSLVVAIGNVICYVVWVKSPGSLQIRLIMEQYGLIEYVTTTGAIFIGFYCLVHYCTPDTESKPLKVSEYVYLSSAFAMIMMAVCELLTGNLSRDSTAKWTVICHGVGIVQVYLQVVFLLHANRCRKSNPRSNIVLLDCVLIFLLVINLNYWIVDSFVLTSFPEIRNVEKDVLGGTLWNLFVKILLPAGVFFRFSSVLQMFTIFNIYHT